MRRYRITNATSEVVRNLNLLSIFEEVSISSVVEINSGEFIEFDAFYPDQMLIGMRFVNAIESLGMVASLSCPTENAVYMEVI